MCHVSPQLLDRIKALGIIPVPQQHFIGELGDGFKVNIGPERARWCYPQRSYLDRNIPIPGSSDRPVIKGAPLLGIHDAVNQKTDSGEAYAPEEKITAEAARKLLAKAPGIVVMDDPQNNVYPLATDAAGKDLTLVGRIREDESIPNGINMWVVADNIRKGAATNTVQIAEILARKYL